jgi:hypothetical protein
MFCSVLFCAVLHHHACSSVLTLALFTRAALFAKVTALQGELRGIRDSDRWDEDSIILGLHFRVHKGAPLQDVRQTRCRSRGEDRGKPMARRDVWRTVWCMQVGQL